MDNVNKIDIDAIPEKGGFQKKLNLRKIWSYIGVIGVFPLR